MSDTRLIGIHGRRGSGKDTVYQFIREIAQERGQRAVRRAFADPLKVSAARALGFDGDTEACVELCNRLKETGKVSATYADKDYLTRGLNISGREFLQRYGTEAHRDVFGDNFWVDAILPLGGDPVAGNHWSNRFDRADYACVTDVRFPNEAERILDLGGVIWQVVRPEADAVGDGHASEKPLSLDQVSLVIDNGGDFEGLKASVRTALEQL